MRVSTPVGLLHKLIPHFCFFLLCRLVLQKILHVLGHTCDVAINGLEAVVAVTGRLVSLSGSPLPREDGGEKSAGKSYDLILMVSLGVGPSRTVVRRKRLWNQEMKCDLNEGKLHPFRFRFCSNECVQ
jgi:hypothetical protein